MTWKETQVELTKSRAVSSNPPIISSLQVNVKGADRRDWREAGFHKSWRGEMTCKGPGPAGERTPDGSIKLNLAEENRKVI